MGLENFTKIAQGIGSVSSSAGALYNVFGPQQKKQSTGIGLGGSGIGSLPVSGGGFNAPNNAGGLSFKPVESEQISNIARGGNVSSGLPGNLSSDHYSKLLQILGVPRG